MDVIVCWPRYADYPLWRQFIRDNRERFGRVFVVFTEHDGADLSGWVRSHFPDVECIDSPDRGDRDWRDVAVNAALERSSAESVWFTEQDFLVTDAGTFWPQVDGAVVGIPEDGSRALHPACIFATRALIERTSRYFGPDPVDHFCRFASELTALAPARLIVGGWAHMAGTSQNHFLIDRGSDAGIYHRDRFRAYLADSLRVAVPLEPGWAARAQREITG